MDHANPDNNLQIDIHDVSDSLEDTSEIVTLDAIRLIEHIHQRQLSCVEVLEAYLSHIERCNPKHNALIALQDHELLLATAIEKDQLTNHYVTIPLLHGVPQAPKDLQPVAGMLSTKGSLAFKGTIPTSDSALFSRLRKAGPLFVGRTNTPEFGLGGHTYNQVYGITANAFVPTLSSGGSSGGAGVAVATHMLPIADGSDMMGSLRTPAAFNSVYGLRPTPGLIPNGIADPTVTPSLAVAGPMARNIPDLALMFSVLADFPESMPFMPEAHVAAFTDPLSRDFTQLRVGWMGDLSGYLPFEEGVITACEQALSTFEQVGCRVESYVPAFDYNKLWQSWIDLRSYLFFRNNVEALKDSRLFKLIKPEAKWEFERGRLITEEQVTLAKRVRQEWMAVLNSAFASYDYLLIPSTQVFPFSTKHEWPACVGGQDMDTYHRWMEVVILASMGGTPALSVPVNGVLPSQRTGIQIIARPYAELAVLQLAHAYDLARTTI